MKMWKLTFACLALSSAFTGSAYAYDKACVSLLVGAGYAAEMRTKVDLNGTVLYTDWTGSFPIGQTKCQDVSFVPPGSSFVTEVHAVLGETKTCTPTITQAGGEGSAVWQAWGTTLNVSCQQPSE